MERTVNKLMLGIIKQLVNGNELNTGEILEVQKEISCKLTKAKVLGEPTAELETSLEELKELDNILHYGMEL